MKFIQLIIVLVALLLISSICLSQNLTNTAKAQTTSKTYFGVDIAFQGVAATEQFIDKICNFTNLVVFGSTNTTYEDSSLTQVCQYALDKGMYFMVFTAWNARPSQQWMATAPIQWGNHFLGFYIDDELGGKQLENSTYQFVRNANNITDAQTKFTGTLSRYLTVFHNQSNWPTFTSDYSLYYFDYKVGYDTVFAEFVWNYSRQINVALCRGAASMEGKNWGAMISWKYDVSPFIESGTDLNKDLMYAYNNGAKYIIIFDTDKNYTQNILGQEHLDVMNQFWNYIQNHSHSNGPISERTAYVLPAGFAYGFRGPEDKIWGLWPANETSFFLSISMNIMLEKYGTNLDVIYEDALNSGNKYGYGNVVQWNDPTAVAGAWPNSVPWPSSIPTSIPFATATKNSTQTGSPTQQPSSSSEQTKTSSMPEEYLWLAAAGLSVVFILGVAFVFKRNRQQNRSG